MKKALLIVMFMGVAFSVFNDLSNASDYGCENSTGIWRCHTPAVLSNAYGKFSGDIACFSTEASLIDQGCFSAIELQQNVYTKDCTYSFNDNQLVYNPCDNIVLNKGELIPITLDPKDLDLSECDAFTVNTTYVHQCGVDGKSIKFDGVMDTTNMSALLIFITKMEFQGFDIWAFIMSNLLYIVLVIVIIIIAYWVFAPRKTVSKEKTAQKEEVLTKRERRCGRKL